MRKFVSAFVLLAGVLTVGAPAPAGAAASLGSHEALASILAQTGPIETVQYGEFRRREAFRRRQELRRREFRRRQAARRYRRAQGLL